MSQRPVLPWHKIGLTHEEDDITDGEESAELKAGSYPARSRALSLNGQTYIRMRECLRSERLAPNVERPSPSMRIEQIWIDNIQK
jgi:hypothetical protein